MRVKQTWFKYKLPGTKVASPGSAVYLDSMPLHPGMNEIRRSVVSPVCLKYLPVIEFPPWTCHYYCLWVTCVFWPKSLVLADLKKWRWGICLCRWLLQPEESLRDFCGRWDNSDQEEQEWLAMMLSGREARQEAGEEVIRDKDKNNKKLLTNVSKSQTFAWPQ